MSPSYRCDCRPSLNTRGCFTACPKRIPVKGWGALLCQPPPCKNITCQKHNKEPDSPSPCFLSSEDSSRAWRSRCWPPASSTRLPSAATATPWITSLSLGAAVTARASRPPPHRCSLQAASLAWCRWGCSVWGSPSATCGRNKVHRYLDSSGAVKLVF